VKVNYAENLISMQKNSLRLNEKELSESSYANRGGGGVYGDAEALYSVSFSYDSVVPAVVRIFIGATDMTVPKHIRYPHYPDSYIYIVCNHA
jgi:hypothetical protein